MLFRSGSRIGLGLTHPATLAVAKHALLVGGLPAVNSAHDTWPQRVPLTDAEIALLRALTGRMGQVLSREALCRSVGSEVNERAIDVQVTRLRRKIEPDPSFPRYLRTVRGQGYRLVDA